MAQPVLIAWGESEILELTGCPDQSWWGFPFELIEGVSGFQAQQRLHGFCGFKTDLDVEPEDTPAILAIDATNPDQLAPYVDQILASYRAHLHNMGLAPAGT
jgi:hypothetical protein